MIRVPGLTYLDHHLQGIVVTLALLSAVAGLGFGWAFAFPFLAVLCLAQLVALRRRTAERDEALTQSQIWRTRAEIIRIAADDHPTRSIGDRRRLESDWARMRARFDSEAEPFSVALFETHAASPEGPGDMLPDVLAQALADTVRADDSVARIDSATFAVLLASANVHGAIAFIDRVGKEIERSSVGSAGPLLEQIGVGAAEWHPSMRSLMDMLRAADAAMHAGDDPGAEAESQTA